jgi:hypothetical protein
LIDTDVRVAEFCGPDEAAAWLARLREEIAWERHRLRMDGGTDAGQLPPRSAANSPPCWTAHQSHVPLDSAR